MKRQILLLAVMVLLLSVAGCIHTAEDTSSEAVEHEQSSETEIIEENNAESILTAESNQSFSLLDDRLYVNMPGGTEDIAVQYGVMHAPESNQRITQLVYADNNDVMTVNAQEMFYYSSGDTEKDAKEFVDYLFAGYVDDIDVTIEQNSNGLNLIRVTPFVYDTGGTTALVDSAFVVCEDNTIVFVGVYFSCNLVEKSELCKNQSAKIIDSLQLGTRQIGLIASTEMLGKIINIDVDEGCVLVEQNAVDFDVYRIYELTKMNETGASMGIYMGMNPSSSVNGVKKGDEGYIYKDDTILGKDMYWIGTEIDEDVYHWETLLSPYAEENIIGLTLHIFFTSSSDEEFEKIASMLRTMEFITE